jgi:micrococcal nuclease
MSKKIAVVVIQAFVAWVGLGALASIASGATLQAKVIEVDSGNTLVVSNTSRPLHVRFKAIVPPLAGQSFSDAAREHLKSLVLDKAVIVEYTHLAEGYLEAKVFLNGIDVGSQMLRDGVAWYDRTSDYELNASDRLLYEQCEQAARNEKRGLWGDPEPISPWEFRKQQQARLNNSAPPASFRESQERRDRVKRSLSNDDLLGAMVGPSSTSNAPKFRPIASNGSADRWMRFESQDEHFSVQIPSNAVEADYSFTDPEGKLAIFHYLAAAGPDGFYLLVSGRGPGAGETDAAFSDQVVRGYIDGMNQQLKAAGAEQLVSEKAVRDVSVNGFIGKQFSLSGPGFSGSIRVLSRRVGDRRELFMLCVMSRSGADSSGDQFLKSFRIN